MNSAIVADHSESQMVGLPTKPPIFEEIEEIICQVFQSQTKRDVNSLPEKNVDYCSDYLV